MALRDGLDRAGVTIRQTQRGLRVGEFLAERRAESRSAAGHDCDAFAILTSLAATWQAPGEQARATAGNRPSQRSQRESRPTT